VTQKECCELKKMLKIEKEIESDLNLLWVIPIGWLVGWLVGQSVGWLVNPLVGWSILWLVKEDKGARG